MLNLPLTVVIAEDEPLARETLRLAVTSRSELKLLAEAEDGKQALALVEQHQPDLLLLDIQMPEMNGLDVLKQLQHHPMVVFTTAYDQYAVSAFELNALDYLLKPFTYERFHAAINRVLESPRQITTTPLNNLSDTWSAQAAPLERILVRDRGQILPILTRQIAYLKADAKYTALYVEGKTYLVRLGISELEQRLDRQRFIRIHRSVIVNLDYVLTMKADEQSQLQLHMQDGSVLIANRDVSKFLRDQVI